MFLRLSGKIKYLWPFLLIISVNLVYLYYLLIDSRYFFYDDFTGLTFSVPRSYTQIISDSLASRDIDRHKILGYMATKWLYSNFGTNVDAYFTFNFLIHTSNSLLLFLLLKRITNNVKLSVILASVFAYRFYLWWFSNIHTLMAAGFSFTTIHLWLNYIKSGKKINYLWMWLILPLLVYSYGPGFFVYPALLPFTIFFNKNLVLKKLLLLAPFIILLGIYFVFYTRVGDSQLRFADPQGNYYRPINLSTFMNVQSQYITAINSVIPFSNFALILITSILLFLSYIFPLSITFLISYFFAIAPNSFFPNHTMFYYLYFPITFILLFFAELLQRRRWLWALVIFLILFNPVQGIYKILFRIKHPSVHFEKQAMAKIVRAAESAINNQVNQVRLSNWDVTPNLNHAMDYQALPYFLSSSKKFDYHYSYSRDTQILTLTPIR